MQLCQISNWNQYNFRKFEETTHTQKYGKTHWVWLWKGFLCLRTSEFHVKFHLKNQYRTHRFAICAISVFRVKFSVEFTRQAVNFSIESTRPPWCFFVAGKEPGLLRSSSKYPTTRGRFCKAMIVGVTGRLFFYPRRPKKDRDKIRSEIFALRCRKDSSSTRWKLVFQGQRRQCCLFFLSLLQMLLCFISSVKGGSAVIEKVLLCGGDRRERAMAVLIDFIKVLW